MWNVAGIIAKDIFTNVASNVATDQINKSLKKETPKTTRRLDKVQNQNISVTVNLQREKEDFRSFRQQNEDDYAIWLNESFSKLKFPENDGIYSVRGHVNDVPVDLQFAKMSWGTARQLSPRDMAEFIRPNMPRRSAVPYQRDSYLSNSESEDEDDDLMRRQQITRWSPTRNQKCYSCGKVHGDYLERNQECYRCGKVHGLYLERNQECFRCGKVHGL